MDRKSSSSSSINNNHNDADNNMEARRTRRLFLGRRSSSSNRRLEEDVENDDDDDDDKDTEVADVDHARLAAMAVASAAARNHGQKRRSRRRASAERNSLERSGNDAKRPGARGAAAPPPPPPPPAARRRGRYKQHHNNHDNDDDDEEEDHHEFQPPAAAANNNLEEEAAADNPLRDDSNRNMQAAAAAAAGAAGDPWLHSLVEHLRGVWAASDLGEDTPIDLQKARNVLEASAGNASLAAQLYWDDFIASHAAAAAAAAAGQHRARRDSGGGGGGESEHSRETDPEEDEEEDEDDEMVEGAVRRVRRRLDDLVERGGQADVHPRVAAAAAAVARQALAAAAAAGGGDAVGQVAAAAAAAAGGVAANAPEAAEELAAAVPGRGHVFALMPGAALDVGSVSVSDDETTGVSAWRAVGRLVSQVDDIWAENELIRRQRPRPLPPPFRPNQHVLEENEVAAAFASGVDEQADLGDLDEDSLVMFEAVNQVLEEPVGAAALRSPTDLLWGMGPNRQMSERESSTSNVIAAEDETAVEVDHYNMGIPRTWLNTGFHLSECGTGLIVKPPPKEELAFFTRRQQQNARGQQRNTCPPPYHCRAVTGIISIVTALLYSGASIQGDCVNCTSAKTPFAELSATDKKRQFQSRLADALSALLLVAAQASLKRKKKALAKRREVNSDKGTMQKLEHRVRLFPTCWWEKDATTGEVRVPDGQDASQRVQMSVSLTNIHDLHTYVLSNMQYFMSPGGCALFMETILGIHGRNVIKVLLAGARRLKANVPTAKALVATESLISCTCEERQKILLQEPKSPSAGNPSKLIDATPPGHECLSIELLSLLLTGEVHSTLNGWWADHLGIGILSNKADQVGWHLRHPERPIWILRGPTCYSMLWRKEGRKDADATVRRQGQTQRAEDAPGQVVELSHWNCWYAEENHTELRLMTAREAWAPPTIKVNTKPAADSLEKENKTVAGILERRKQRLQLVRAELDKGIKHSDKSGAGNDDADEEDDSMDEQLLDRIRVHPDDLKYYPNDIKLCRFDVGELPEVSDDDRKPHGEHWTPYYRLSRKQRRLVRLKLGPKIIPILETRWPQAPMVQVFKGDGPDPIV